MLLVSVHGETFGVVALRSLDTASRFRNETGVNIRQYDSFQFDIFWCHNMELDESRPVIK